MKRAFLAAMAQKLLDNIKKGKAKVRPKTD